ncbi:cytochrome P450 [Sinobacterium caligoides]|uniref:Cytochrome P450 n=1 Tax=Sinobacterium caligoides TaxID=933926 RepID=A0A3N2DQ63_9GAMM|nr:cytochrome P450 [Sinobacterium caligoides]ROS01822.1 cytochrome P450 [Sinobacterium caligoides]
MAEAVTIDKEYQTAPDNRDLSHIPGADGLPYIGKGLKFIFSLDTLAQQHYDKFGEVSRVRALNQAWLMVLGADNWQRILLDREKNFSTKKGYESSLGDFYPDGLLLRDHDEHKLQRRLLQKAFKTQAMKGYITQMTPVLQRKIAAVDVSQPCLFGPMVKDALLDVGAKIFIGMDVENDDTARLNKAFVDINHGLLAQVKFDIPGTSFGRGKRGMRALHSFFRDEIPLRRKGSAEDMFSHMCREQQDDGRYFDDWDVIANAAFLLFAAHDTTTSTLNSIMMYTTAHPEWQEKMRAEVEALAKDELDYDDLDKLVVIDRVFHEAIRLVPPAPIGTRRTIRECEMGGYTIPANTKVFIPFPFNHRDPRYWTEPLRFDPDRFSPERQEHKNHPFCYHPFGGGAHKCIGMHFAAMLVKVFMFHFLKHYRYRTPEDYQPKLQWAPLPKPTKLPLLLERI